MFTRIVVNNNNESGTEDLSSSNNKKLDELLDEEVLPSLLDTIHDGTGLTDIASVLLYNGFTQGKWNPDMMLLLIEPLMYLVMSLCEKAGVKYTLYRGEEEGDQTDDIEEKSSIFSNLCHSTIIGDPNQIYIDGINILKTIS